MTCSKSTNALELSKQDNTNGTHAAIRNKTLSGWQTTQ